MCRISKITHCFCNAAVFWLKYKLCVIDTSNLIHHMLLDRLRGQSCEAQQTEAAIGVAELNRTLAARGPNSVRIQKVLA